MWISTTIGPAYDYTDVAGMTSTDFYVSGGRPVRFPPREIVVRTSVQARWRLEPTR